MDRRELALEILEQRSHAVAVQPLDHAEPPSSEKWWPASFGFLAGRLLARRRNAELRRAVALELGALALALLERIDGERELELERGHRLPALPD